MNSDGGDRSEAADDDETRLFPDRSADGQKRFFRQIPTRLPCVEPSGPQASPRTVRKVLVATESDAAPPILPTASADEPSSMLRGRSPTPLPGLVGAVSGSTSATPAPPLSGSRSVGASVIVGSVVGQVAIETIVRVFWGTRVLTVSFLGAIAVELIARGGYQTPLITAVLIVLAAMAVIYQFRLLPLASCVPRQSGKPVDGARSPGEISVRRFRVRTIPGGTVACSLAGEIGGTDIRSGDVVRVTGRRTRGGDMRVTGMDILTGLNGSTIGRMTVRPRMAFSMAQWGSRVCFMVAMLVLAGTIIAKFGLS